MRLKLFLCLALGVLGLITPAMAVHYDPFLSVDINGYNAGGGQAIGPTAAGFQGFEAAEGLFLPANIDWGSSGAAGLTNIYGPYTVNVKGVAPNSFLGARNRGANTDPLSDMTSDFVFAQRNVDGFGQTFIKITVSGLTPGETYKFSGYARDHFNGGTDSFQAWSDRNRLGGLDGPGAWMDANFPATPPALSLYQPAPGGVNNPIPTARRSAVSGPAATSPYDYGGSFYTTADAGGVIEVYGWGDPNSYSGTQTATLLNGFRLAEVPEPASMGLLAISLVGLTLKRRLA